MMETLNSKAATTIRPSVAAIVPAHNSAATIAETMRSILRQSEMPDEIILVDDGSTDDTSRIASEIAPKSRIIRQTQSGAAAARNAGALATDCEWLAFLDADDVWPPERTAALLAAVYEHPQAAIIHGRISILAARPDVVIDQRMMLADGTHLPYSVGTAFIRRDVWIRLGGMSTAHERGEDTDFYLRFRESGLPLVAIDAMTLIYMQHGANQSRQVDRSNAALLGALRDALQRRRRDKDYSPERGG